ncbi:MAG: gliding motility-associated C-terminal domain-containing protein, partial [Bacteroidia bacterium]|nr:gliding motility-associated C-terminal domain-containing protein [Bacteroidia bacterium]
GQTTQAIVVKNTGNYTVQVWNTCGNPISNPVAIQVNPNPIADFIASPLTLNVTETVNFTDLSTGNNLQQWLWNFGNGATATTQNPVYSYPDSGTYTVILQVIDAKNCKDTTQKDRYIWVLDNQTIFIPTAFTPNGDGLNDVFEIVSLGIKDFHMTIWNRWGTKIWETHSLTPYWNGKVDGEDVAEDAYVYRIEATTVKNIKVERTGTITVIR